MFADIAARVVADLVAGFILWVIHRTGRLVAQRPALRVAIEWATAVALIGPTAYVNVCRFAEANHEAASLYAPMTLGMVLAPLLMAKAEAQAGRRPPALAVVMGILGVLMISWAVLATCGETAT